ncbi:MAG: extracellular solute-binding protein [Rhizobiaceae bacterium]|nr:extracellular solute-binding protein [Rhizobiaceae bacterium]
MLFVNTNRRRVLQSIASAGSLPLALSLGVNRSVADDDLRVFDFAGYEVPDLHQPYIKKYGSSPSITIFADGDEAFVKLRSGFNTDLVHLGTFEVQRMRDAGLIEPWDVSRLSNWPDVFPYFNDAPGILGDGKLWMIPTDWGYDSVLYRTDLVDVPEQSWSLLWDKRYAGKISYGTELYPAIAGAALTLGIKDPFNASDEEFDKIHKRLTELRDLVKFFWSDPTTVEQAIASGEVVAAWTWSSSYKTLKSQGVPVKLMQKPKEGVSSWVAGFCRLKNGGNEQKAYDYVDAWLSTETGKWLIENYSYASVNRKSFDLVDPAILADIGLSAPSELLEQSLTNTAMAPELHERYSNMFLEVQSGF